MSAWIQQVLDRAGGVQDGLSLKRQQSLQTLKNTPWPTRKTEAWKYTPVKVIEQLELPPVAANQDVYIKSITDLDCIDIIFVDGVPQTSLVQALPAGLQVYALDDKAQQAKINRLFASIKPSAHYFGLVNDVLATTGVFIEVTDNSVIDKPIRIVSTLTQGAEAHVRVLVRLGEQSACNLIEQADGNDSSLSTFVSECQLGQGAKLNHYRLALQTEAAITLAGNHFHLDERAELNANLVAFGSKLSRIDVDVIHGGQHSQANLNSLYLLDNEELFDLHACVEHTVANGKTQENVRGIVGGRGKAVFNGRIHIHPDAQKTDAQLNNRNLLLSKQAEVDTKPELEIYADDVRCAHGATVAQMEERSLYYLQSRGIERQQAQAMITFGFINELLDQMPHTEIANWLRPQIRRRFDVAFQTNE